MATTPTTAASPLSAERLDRVDSWWRAANYLSVGQIYLLDNPLLKQPLEPDHIKPRLLGHWGTTPGLNFVYAHLNRVIVERDLHAVYVCGPGHGGPGMVANARPDGPYSELFAHVSQDAAGMHELFRQFSFPGGVPSHAAPETPGSIHEGGELGYALSHAYGAALDNPDLVVACVIGDGESETGPLATSWHGNKFLNPATDGAVLPLVHRILADTLDTCLDEIAAIQRAWRQGSRTDRPAWPTIVLRTPKGWTGPRTVDGVPVEGTYRSHQVPLARVRENPEHLAQLERWLRSY